jgi:hypothetical protein
MVAFPQPMDGEIEMIIVSPVVSDSAADVEVYI